MVAQATSRWRNRAAAATLCLISAAAWAQAPATAAPPAVRDPADRLFREQSEREREQLLRSTPLPALVIAAPEQPGFPQDRAEDGPVFLVQTIRANGDPLLSPRQLERIAAPFVSRTLGSAHIRVLLDRITRALVAAGYVTSRAYVGNQNLREGELTVTVLAGRIESIRYNGELLRPGEARLPGVRLALPMRQGDVLRLQDIEQAIDQLNRLRRNAVQVQIQPGEHAGGSVIDLRNNEGPARKYSVSADNQGSASTGRLRLQAGVEQGNGLGLMETMSLGLTSSKDTNALYGTLSLPLGYYTLTGMLSWSEYQSLIGNTALVHGTSQNFSLALNRLLARDQNSKTAIDVSLAKRRSDRAINNAALTPQNLAVLRLGINHLRHFGTPAGDGQWSLDTGVVRGLKGLGADHDAAELPGEAAHAQFTKVEVSGASRIPQVTGVSWRGRLAGQCSRTPLFSSEQLFIGGAYSVRGFAESVAGGDCGIYLRNEAVWEVVLPLWSRGLRLEPYAFLDGGAVRSAASGQHQSAVGTGLGLRLAFARGNAEFTVGRPLHNATGMTQGGTRAHASLSYSL